MSIGVLAMLLAISGLGGGNATKEMLNANIQASDTYAFYQAKNIRQTSNQLAADELEALLITQPTLPADALSRFARIASTVTRRPLPLRDGARYRARVKRNSSRRRRPMSNGATGPPGRTRTSTSPRRCIKSRLCSGR